MQIGCLYDFQCSSSKITRSAIEWSKGQNPDLAGKSLTNIINHWSLIIYQSLIWWNSDQWRHFCQIQTADISCSTPRHTIQWWQIWNQIMKKNRLATTGVCKLPVIVCEKYGKHLEILNIGSFEYWKYQKYSILKKLKIENIEK